MTQKQNLIDWIQAACDAARSGNPILIEFARKNLQPILDSLPDNWSLLLPMRTDGNC